LYLNEPCVLADIYDGEEDEEDEDDDENEDGVPDWVESEKEQFKNFRDQDKDGFLNLEEVKNWVIPEEYENSAVEARHLVGSCDEDGVGYNSRIMSLYTKLSTFSLVIGAGLIKIKIAL